MVANRWFSKADYWLVQFPLLVPLTLVLDLLLGSCFTLPPGPLCDEGMVLFLEGGCDWGGRRPLDLVAHHAPVRLAAGDSLRLFRQKNDSGDALASKPLGTIPIIGTAWAWASQAKVVNKPESAYIFHELAGWHPDG